MIAEIDEFRWHLCAGGYVCEAGRPDKKNRVLVPDIEGPESGLAECYPLEVPMLHRDFAALETTEKAVVAFANAWGPLKNAHQFFEPLDPDDEIDSFMWTGDPVDFWFQEIRRMRALVDLYDVILGGREKTLSDVVELQKKGDRTFWDVTIRFHDVPTLRWAWSFNEHAWREYVDLTGMSGNNALARKCLFEMINESLWGSCSPGVGVGSKPNELTLFVCPHNLDAALWLLFVQETFGQKSFRQCLQCKGFFNVSAELDQRRQRSDRKYCSPKCRAAAFRERREQAPVEPQSRRKAKGKVDAPSDEDVKGTTGKRKPKA